MDLLLLIRHVVPDEVMDHCHVALAARGILALAVVARHHYRAYPKWEPELVHLRHPSIFVLVFARLWEPQGLRCLLHTYYSERSLHLFGAIPHAGIEINQLTGRRTGGLDIQRADDPQDACHVIS